MAVDDGVRASGAEFRQRFRAGRHDKVAAEQQIGAARREPHRMDLLRRLGNAHMAQHGAALLRQPSHVEDGDALAFEMPFMPNQRRRHNAGAADPGHQHAVGSASASKFGSGRGGGVFTPALPRLRGQSEARLRNDPPSTVTKLGQKPLRQE